MSLHLSRVGKCVQNFEKQDDSFLGHLKLWECMGLYS